MMWARIEFGQVAELTPIDPTGRYHPSLIWRPCPTQTQYGWTFDGSEYHSPELPQSTTEDYCLTIDTAADTARTQLAGDPLRAVEYQLAAEQAQAYQAEAYQGEVPPMVAAWAVNGRTAEQAANDILTEAARFNRALEQLRSLRLTGKEEVRRLMDQQQTDAALAVTDATLIAINDLLSATLNAR
jgi:hypothetical protein